MTDGKCNASLNTEGDLLHNEYRFADARLVMPMFGGEIMRSGYKIRRMSETSLKY